MYPDGHTSSSSEESEEELEEGEVVDDESDEASKNGESPPLNKLIPPNDILQTIIRFLVQKRDTVFPYIRWEQHVNEGQLHAMFEDLRALVATLPRDPEQEINYHRIVQERPPLGSRFTNRGGYITPEGIVICQTLRNKVRDLQDAFEVEAREQQSRLRVEPTQQQVRFQSSLTLGCRSLFEQDMRARLLIERQYMAPARLPTPNPSEGGWEVPTQERYLGESDQSDSEN